MPKSGSSARVAKERRTVGARRKPHASEAKHGEEKMMRPPPLARVEQPGNLSLCSFTVLLLILLASVFGCAAVATRRPAQHGPGPTIRRRSFSDFEVCEVGARQDVQRAVVVIPGNPGVPAYYDDFLRELADAVVGGASGGGSQSHDAAGAFRLVTVGYRGHHENQGRFFGQVFSVEEQAEHVRCWLDRELANNPHASITVIGHSIGATLALNAVDLLGWPAAITNVCLLTPFLENNKEDAGFARLAKAASIPFMPGMLRIVGLMASLLPFRMRRLMLSSFVQGMDEGAETLTLTAMARGAMLANYVYMGRTEFLSPWLTKGPYGMLQSLQPAQRDRITALFTQEDMWAPLHIMRRLSGTHGIRARAFTIKDAETCGASRLEEDTEDQVVAHAFGVTRAGSRIVARAVLAMAGSSVDRKNRAHDDSE